MGGRLLLPTVERMLADYGKRIFNLERRLYDRGEGDPKEIVFTLPGILAISTSPRFYFADGAVVTRVLASLGTAGTTTTTVQIKHNGNVVGTINLTSGVQVARAVPQVAFGADQDHLTIGVSALGSGARDLDVQVRYV